MSLETINTYIPDWRSRPTLTVTEAAAILGIGRSSAYEAARNGQLPSIHIGGRILVPTLRLVEMLGGAKVDEPC